MLRRPRKILLLAATAVVLVAQPVLAAGGDLDPGFGTGGVVRSSLGPADDQAWDIAIQPDGKIIVAGTSFAADGYSDFAVARYNSDGSLDPTFGSAGIAVTSVVAGFDHAFAVALQPDGKIVAAGDAQVGAATLGALVRYTPDGSLDPSFDGDGIVTTAGVANGRARAVLIQPDGKIVAAGPGTHGMAAVRFHADGALDTGFGTGGVASGPEGVVMAVAIQPDGRLVLAGYASGSPAYDVRVVRFDASGALDPSFGSGGEVTTHAGDAGLATIGNSVLIDAEGRVVVGGGADNRTLLVRYLPDGSLDPTFGTGGIALSAFTTSDEIFDMAWSDGRIVATGEGIVGNKDAFEVSAYHSDGSVDHTFGVSGKTVTHVGSGSDIPRGMAIAPDGSIVAGGGAFGSGALYVSLVRYQSPDASCTITGTAGDDVLTGTAGADVICGLAGSDVLRGAAGNDELKGGAGDDKLQGDAGYDVIDGGSGVDTIGFPGRVTNGVVIDLASPSIDGGVAFGWDTLVVGSIESVVGSTRADTIKGDVANNRLSGNSGDDIISGGLGADRIFGGLGNDSIDSTDGVAGNDRTDGNGGTDFCVGDPSDFIANC